jgi:hypothetical protein
MSYSIQRAAQPGIAADRFAREIVRFLKARCGALAAAECQTVGRLGQRGRSFPFCHKRRSRMQTPSVQIPVVPVLVVLAWYAGSSCCLLVVLAWFERSWCGSPVVPRRIVCCV